MSYHHNPVSKKKSKQFNNLKFSECPFEYLNVDGCFWFVKSIYIYF